MPISSDNNTLRDVTPNNIYGLVERDPQDPGCPTFSLPIGLPDNIGKIFHPNGLGHEVIAAYTLEAATEARAKIIHQPSLCPIVDTQTCYSSLGNSRAYASAEALNNNVKDFCQYVADNAPPSTSGWSRAKVYYSGTPGEYTMLVTLSKNAFTFDKHHCTNAISSIINGCDVPIGGSNPMNWKQGGKRVEGEYTYQVDIYRQNRPWPPSTKPRQSCEGWYKAILQHYDVYGAGWANYDHGQKSLMPSINPCCGSG